MKPNRLSKKTRCCSPLNGMLAFALLLAMIWLPATHVQADPKLETKTEVEEPQKKPRPRSEILEFAILANKRDHEDVFNAIQKLPPGKDLLREDSSLRASWRDAGKNADGKPKEVGTGGEVYQNAKGQFLVVFELPEQRITSKSLSRAYETTDESGRLAVGFELNDQGAARMQRLTSQNLPLEDGFGRRLGILLDKKIHSAPTILTTIGGKGQITGKFKQKAVQDFINQLKAGD